MDTFLQDLKYAVRTLRKSWSVTAIAIATLALGIGANTAIFSVVNSVLLRPLPFRNSDRLVYLLEKVPGFANGIPMNAPDYLAFRERQNSFEQMGIYSNKHFDLSGNGGDPERIEAARASASIFPLLGVSPFMGRTYTEQEDESAQPVVVLGYNLWQRRYGSDSEIVGKTVHLNRQPYTVIGVMPARFEFPLHGEGWSNQPADLWVPMSFTKQEREGWGNMYNHNVLGRLKPGVTLAQAQSDTARVIQQVESIYPPKLLVYLAGLNAHIGMTVTPYSQAVTGDVRLPLLLLLVAVGIVLVIACANVANLLLARSTARHKEIAVRAALGADGWRLGRQMITESVVLGLIAGLAAIFLGGWGMELILSLAPADLPRMQEVHMDWRVLLFALALSLGTAILFGITPAIEASHVDPHDALKEAGRGGGASRGRRKLQSLLIVSQTALAVMLLIGAGLLTRSFTLLLKADPGFRPDHVVTGTIGLPWRAYSKADQIRGFWKDLQARTESMPGVRAVGFSTDLPFDSQERDAVILEDRPTQNNLPNITQSWIMGDYFGAMGITLKRGRYFTPAEIVGPPNQVIINEAAARIYWPGQDPLGKRIRYMGDTYRTVIGIVDDVKDESMQLAAGPHGYTPYLGEANTLLESEGADELRTLHLIVRTSMDSASMLGSLRSVAASIDPQLALDGLQAMDTIIDRSVAPQRFNLALVALFAVLSVFLAAVGVYGVLSYSISQRTREIGVRIALGAQPGRVLNMALREGMRLALLGTAIGLGVGLLLTQLMASLLFGITAHDPLTFAAVAVIVVLVSLLACYIPARRAMRLDPIIALRYE